LITGLFIQAADSSALSFDGKPSAWISHKACVIGSSSHALIYYAPIK